jgi:hypothetical protein
MGIVQRLVVRLRAPLTFARPGDYDGGFLHAWHAPLPTVWPLAPDTFVAWAGGDQAASLPNTRSALQEAAVASLAELAGVTPQVLAAEVADVESADWSGDPFTRGAYAVTLAGQTRDAARLAEPIRGTLFFAGEATELDHAGTVDGALASGVRAAGEVDFALRSEPANSPRP